MEFRNRDRHLQILNQHYERRQASLMVVYGRRRIGKAVLLRHWIENQLSGQHLLWTAHRSTSDVLLAGFSEAVATVTPGVHTQVRFANWPALFEQLFKLAADRA